MYTLIKHTYMASYIMSVYFFISRFLCAKCVYSDISDFSMHNKATLYVYFTPSTIHHHPQPIPRGALEARTGNYEKLN